MHRGCVCGRASARTVCTYEQLTRKKTAHVRRGRNAHMHVAGHIQTYYSVWTTQAPMARTCRAAGRMTPPQKQRTRWHPASLRASRPRMVSASEARAWFLHAQPRSSQNVGIWSSEFEFVFQVGLKHKFSSKCVCLSWVLFGSKKTKFSHRKFWGFWAVRGAC